MGWLWAAVDPRECSAKHQLDAEPSLQGQVKRQGKAGWGGAALLQDITGHKVNNCFSGLAFEMLYFVPGCQA